MFCPRCRQLFHPNSNRHLYLDGAYFGTTFPHLFILSHPELMVWSSAEEGFEPRIFGFRIHKSSAYFNGTEVQHSAPVEGHSLDAVEDGELEDLDDEEESTIVDPADMLQQR